jgi:CBS domain-containing protein
MKIKDWLQSNTVADVMLSKTKRSHTFYSVPNTCPIADVMVLLGSNDISAIAVYDEVMGDSGFCHWECSKRSYKIILTAADILKFFFETITCLKARNVSSHQIESECLDLPIAAILESLDLIERKSPLFIKKEEKLCELLEIWIEAPEPDFSSHRVLVGNEENVEGVVTMADFLHYVYVSAHQLQEVLQVHALAALYPGTKTPSPIQSQSLIVDTEKTFEVLKRLVHSSCSGVVGIVDGINGTLLGSISVMEFLPVKSKSEIFIIIDSLEKPIFSFTKNVCNNPAARLVDVITFREQMNMEDLIQRLLKLRVHLLWRLGFTGHVIGMVTVHDILKYLRSCSR